MRERISARPQSYSYGIKYYEIATGQVTTITNSNMNYWRYGISVEGCCTDVE